MSEYEPQRDAESPDDPLDQLLSEAEWPEADAEAVNRLRQRWRSLRTVQRGRQRRRRLVFWLTASAAGVALVAGGWWLWRPAPEPGRAVAPVIPERPAERIAVDDGAEDPGVSDVRAPDSRDRDLVRDKPVVASSTSSRPATPYELLLIRSIERRSSIPPAERPPTVESIIHEFLSDPNSDASEFAVSLAVDHATCEQKLLALIDDAPAHERTRIVQLLEHVGSRRSVPRLMELSRSSETHNDAVRALTVLADVETIAGLAIAETDEFRREMISELLSRQSDEALAAFLDLLADGRTREAALAVLDNRTMPPVERLFDFMRGSDYSRRWAAAVVLGRLDDPVITERLIRLAQGNVNRQEALAGLLASRDEQAGQFVSIAARDQTMIGAVYSARLQLQLMSQQTLSQQRWRNLP